MIKIRTAQLAAVPSHIRKNLKQIEKEAALARAEGAHILVLPEMCLTGYLIGDLWDQNAFLKECERANEKVAALSKGLTIVWGSLAVDWDLINDDGRPRKYNAAFAASNGHFIYPEGSPLPFTVKTLHLPGIPGARRRETSGRYPCPLRPSCRKRRAPLRHRPLRRQLG